MAEPVTCRTEGCKKETGGSATCNKCHDTMVKAWVAKQEKEYGLPKLSEVKKSDNDKTKTAAKKDC